MSSDASTLSTGGETSSDRPSDRGAQSGPSHEENVSILDLLLALARNKTVIIRVTLGFALLGVTYSILVPEQYTSSARVVRETQVESGVNLPGGISPGMLSGLGISLGGVSSGLTPQAFPDVLQSRQVKLAVVQDTFRFPEVDRPMTFVDYANRPMGPLDVVLQYTLYLPWTLKRGFGNLISDSPTPTGATSTGETKMLSEEEHDAIEAVEDMVVATVDQENGLMTISVTAGGPYLAFDLTQSFVEHLTARVREIRTKKVRERLGFVRGRFREAEQELERAENRLAQFLERNQNPTTATLRFRRDRLQRQVSFKEQLYSELQGQLTQTRLDLQRRQPVVTVVDEPAPPFQRSAPQRTLIVIFSVFLGGILSVGAVLFLFVMRSKGGDGQREKISKLKKHLNLDIT